jgi:hypothetical protein
MQKLDQEYGLKSEAAELVAGGASCGWTVLWHGQFARL